MKKTFKNLLEIDQIYGRLLQKEGFENTKLGYSFKRFTEKNTKKIFTDYNEELQDNRINNALTDEKTGAILYHTNGKDFQYSKEGLKAVLKNNKESVEKWQDKEFEVTPFICKELGSIEFTEDEVEVLKGVII